MQDYVPIWQKMQDFTARRDENTLDELWLLQHPPVFTQGLNGKPEHLLNQADIPLVEIDRGGQITYHGPGQLIVYCLIDLKRKKLGVRQMVNALENAVISYLADQNVIALARADAPGVYVADAKVAALGLKVKRGCSYHGLSLNVDMDLAPFTQINPCGYENLAVTQLKALDVNHSMAEVEEMLVEKIASNFSVDRVKRLEGF